MAASGEKPRSFYAIFMKRNIDAPRILIFKSALDPGKWLGAPTIASEHGLVVMAPNENFQSLQDTC